MGGDTGRTDWEMANFRFVVRDHQGKEVQASSVPWPRPAKDKLEPGKLSNPAWHRTSYDHGDKAEMMVEAPGLDGKKVRFVVELHVAGEKWKQVAEATATVSNGRASGSAEIKGDELHNPRCISEKGKQPLLVVDAPGIADGREVEFTIETETNGKWQAQAPAKGVVKGAKAEAKVKLLKGKHRFHAAVLPEHADGNLRFRAELM